MSTSKLRNFSVMTVSTNDGTYFPKSSTGKFCTAREGNKMNKETNEERNNEERNKVNGNKKANKQKHLYLKVLASYSLCRI